jgi:hypothetical protein
MFKWCLIVGFVMGTVLSITGNSIPRSNVEFESFLHHYFDVNASYGAEPIYGMSTTSMGEVEHHSDAAGYDHRVSLVHSQAKNPGIIPFQSHNKSINGEPILNHYVAFHTYGLYEALHSPEAYKRVLGDLATIYEPWGTKNLNVNGPYTHDWVIADAHMVSWCPCRLTMELGKEWVYPCNHTTVWESQVILNHAFGLAKTIVACNVDQNRFLKGLWIHLLVLGGFFRAFTKNQRRTLLWEFAGLFCCSIAELATRFFRMVLVGSCSVVRFDSRSIQRAMFWIMVACWLDSSAAVTCYTCYDQVAGCTGGAACPLQAGTAANVVALAAAGGTIAVASLLPLSYVRHLPSQVLRTLAAITRRPADGAPPDLAAMTLVQLQECLDNGRIEVSAYRSELSNRLSDPATAAAQITRIAAMLQAVQTVPEGRGANNKIDGIATDGPIGYLVAVASLIVASGNRSYSSGVGTPGGSSSQASMSIKVPSKASSFFELIMVWQALAHATGSANYLASTPFVQQVVFNSISSLGMTWQEAYCLFIVYIEAIEDSRGTLNLGNVYAYGAQDSRLKAAAARRSEFFSSKDGDKDGDKDNDKPGSKFNGKDSPNAVRICKTYNYKDAVHPPQHVHKDGTCKFRHVCMQWVTGKGAYGCCEGKHAKFDCTNPGKCQEPEK